jgi:hypothetical protein
MSVLKNLKLSAVAPSHVSDPKLTARSKLLRYLNEQRAAAQADVEGRPYNATKTVFRNGENGQRVRAEAPRHVRRGWFKDAAGTLFFQARYGSKPLELSKGMTCIEIGKLDALPSTIDTLIQAIDAGELDEALAAASAERKANFKPRVKKGG